MKYLKGLILVTLVFVLAYFLSRKTHLFTSSVFPETARQALPSMDLVGQGQEAASPQLSPLEDIPQVQPGFMQIKTAFFSILVKDVKQSIQEIADLSSRLQGYVISSHVYQTGESGNLQGQVSFKVPQSKFDEALSALRSLSVSVESETVTGQDVTEEFTDLSARLRNKQAAETGLLELMKKTGSVADILQVQRELTQVREDIERLTGRLTYLEKNIAMSTINVDLTTQSEYLPLSEEKWRPLTVAKSALRTLLKIIKAALSLFIWLLVFTLPVLFLLLLPFVLLLKFLRKKR